MGLRSSVLDGYVLCFAGTFSRKQHDWQPLVEAHGGAFAPAMRASVTHLVLSDRKGHGTAKHSEALRRGLPCLTEAELEALMDGRGAAVPLPTAATPPTAAVTGIWAERVSAPPPGSGRVPPLVSKSQRSPRQSHSPGPALRSPRRQPGVDRVTV